MKCLHLAVLQILILVLAVPCKGISGGGYAPESINVLWPPASSLVSARSLEAVGIRCEFFGMSPWDLYEIEATWELGSMRIVVAHVETGPRRWSLAVPLASRTGPRGSSARAVVVLDGLLMDTFFAAPRRGSCEPEELSLTLRLVKLVEQSDFSAPGRIVVASTNIGWSAFGKECPGIQGEVRSERIIADWPPEGESITRTSLQRTGFIARVDYLHPGVDYLFHVRAANETMTFNVEHNAEIDDDGLRDIYLRSELPLLPAGDHVLKLRVEALGWGVVAQSETYVSVVRDEVEAAIGGWAHHARKSSNGTGSWFKSWSLNKEWCIRTERNAQLCTGSGSDYRANDAPPAQGGGEDEDEPPSGDVQSASRLCEGLHLAGISTLGFLGDSFARQHYISVVMLLTNDFTWGALMDVDEQAGESRADILNNCGGWKQFLGTVMCQDRLKYLINGLCGGRLTVSAMIQFKSSLSMEATI